MDEVWKFETAKFKVALVVERELDDPADHFEFESDVEYARSGDLCAWFCARVVVSKWNAEKGDWVEIGDDALGGCSYASIEDFYTGHRDADPMNRNCTTFRAAHGDNAAVCHYFPSMVKEAVSVAKSTLA